MAIFPRNNQIAYLKIDKDINATGITLSTTELEVQGIGATAKLSYTFVPTGAKAQTMYFKSSDINIATVDSNGNIKGVKTGRCTVTVYNATESIVAFCNVTVSIPATSLTVSPTSYTIPNVGDYFTISPTIAPSNTTDTITYKVGNPSILEVFSNGTVVAKAKGSSTVTVTAGSKTATVNVQVGVAVSSLTLNKTSCSFTKESLTETLIPTLLPATASDSRITWSSNNPKVATVSETGIVMSVASGTATITATSVADPTKTATCQVTVSIPPSGIKLNKNNIEFNTLNATSNLIATVLPESANNKTVTWSTSNSAVATVANGVVTSKGYGSCTITATNASGQSTTAIILVHVGVQSLTLLPSTLTLNKIGDTASLTANISPSNAHNQTLTWSSSDSTIVSVTNGILVAKKSGTVTITATAVTGAKATASVTVKVPVESVTLSKNLYETNTPSGSFTLTATVLPTNSTIRTVTWSTSNPNVATVTNGVVTIKGFGETIIKATSDGKTDECIVRVKEILLEKIVLEQTSCKFSELNQTFQIQYSLLPTNVYNKTITFTKVAGDFTVSPTGLVTCYGLNGGTIRIQGSNNVYEMFTVRIDSVNIANIIYREKIANLRASMQTASNKIAQTKTDIAKDDINKVIQDLQDGYNKEIGELDKAVTNIKDNVLAGIEDNVLDEIEKAKIEASLSTLATEKMDVDAQYNKVYGNQDLVDTTTSAPKTNLKNMYDQYVKFYNYLIGAINDVLEATEITDNTKSVLNSRFNNHDLAYSYFKSALQTAINAISSRKAELAVSEAKNYTDAKIQIESDRITSTVSSVNKLNQQMSTAQSTITQLSNSITSKVDVNGVQSVIQQDPTSIKIGFNKISNVVEITSNGINLRTSSGSLHTQLYQGTVQFMRQSNTNVSLGKFQRNKWTGTSVEGLFCNMDLNTTFGVGFWDGNYYMSPFVVAGSTIKLSETTVHKGLNLLAPLYMNRYSISEVGNISAVKLTVSSSVTNGMFICAANYVKAPYVQAVNQMHAPEFVKTRVTYNEQYNAKTKSVETVKNEINTLVTDTITPNIEFVGSRYLKDSCKVEIPDTLKQLGQGHYVIQLTPIGKKDIFVSEKTSDYFIVEGDECDFDFVVKMLSQANTKILTTDEIDQQARIIEQSKEEKPLPMIKFSPDEFK